MPEAVAWDALPRDRLERMRDAGIQVLECFRVLHKTDDNLVGELLKSSETFYEWDHYPAGDVYDGETHSQYYYHAHPKDERPGEHGHFHTFLRPKGMPTGMSAAPIPDLVLPDDPDDALSHLIAISMDERGIPFKLFTTNRWVTGEVWYAADDVVRMLDHFDIDHAQPSWPVNLWITAMVALFQPQIAALIHARDAALARWQREHPGIDAYEDRDFEVAAELCIDVDAQIAAVARALNRAAA